jgi:predicted ribonuclease YlaK
VAVTLRLLLVGGRIQPLNRSQRTAVQDIFASRNQVMALEGSAGTGKTTALAAVRDAAEREGYQVEGFAPT